uniref:hypothetical protein n=1 Tax=Klebsiella pneumoniae TaxID=573 RepID=UPI003B98164C
PFVYNDYLTKKKKLKSNQAEAIRDTTMQPTSFVDSYGESRINRRKIRELPNFIKRLPTDLKMQLGCEHVMFSYEFMYGYFK